MKSLVNGTIFTLLLTNICFAQWFWQNPLPQGNTLEDVTFIGSDTAVAVGNFGTIMKTTDGGVSWIRKECNTTAHLRDVKFVNKMSGLQLVIQEE